MAACAGAAPLADVSAAAAAIADVATGCALPGASTVDDHEIRLEVEAEAAPDETAAYATSLADVVAAEMAQTEPAQLS